MPSVRRLRWLLLLASLSLAAPASAQNPLCPPPHPQDTYYRYCSPWARDLVDSFLYDFSVAQLFRGRESFEMPLGRVLDAMGYAELLFATKESRDTILSVRPVVEFRPLDRIGESMSGRGYSSSGEFISKSTAGAQSFEVKDPVTKASVRIDVPETLQGMYWRSPAHMELQFYAGHGLRFRLSAAADDLAPAFEESVQCISITRLEARAVTTAADHRHLISRFGACQ